MSKLIRRTVGSKKRGTALIVALQLTALTFLSLVSFVGKPQQQQSANPPADSQTSAAVAGGGLPAVASVKAGDAGTTPDQAQTQSDQTQTQTAQAPTTADKSALRASAHFAKKLQEPLATQVFNLATSRAESGQHSAQQSSQEGEEPTEGPTLTTDREDYPPFSYVYFHGSGFQPGETVDMIVVETDPIQQSFDPWQVVADENGEFDTSWYVFSQDFNGATFLATATGETSQLTASATFTDANGDGTMVVSPGSVQSGSTGNSFTFSFRNVNQNFNNAAAHATVVVPAATAPGWTTPTLGNVSVSPVGTGATASIASITGSSPGPYTITVNFNTGGASAGAGFNLTYSGVTAPSTTGVNTFTTGNVNGGGATTAIFSSPSIVVSPTIQLRGTATTASVSTGTSVTINKPSGVVQGDVMIANFAINNTTSGAPSLGGWTSIATTTSAGNSASVRAALLYKVAGASEPANYTFTWTTSNAAQGAIVAFSGVDTVSGPFDATLGTYTIGDGNGGQKDPVGVTAITNATANAAIVMFASSPASIATGLFTTAASPGALSELYGDIADSNANGGAGWGIKMSAGSTTGAGSATRNALSNRAWAAILLALKPITCTAPSIATNPADQTKTYGDPSVSFTATANGNPAPTVQWQVSVSNGPFTNIGGATSTTYTITNPTVAMNGNKYQAVFTNTCNGSQTATSSAATLTVNPKALNITASNQSKTYGTAFTFAGTEFTTGAGELVSPDTVTSITLTSTGAAATATVVAPGPTYDITPSAAVGTGLGNYTIAYHVGHFTVNSKGLDITANDRTKTYGDTVTFAGTEFITGAGQLVNSDSVASVTLASTGAPASATVTAPGPTYAITATAATGTGLGNYTIAYHNGTLTVSQKAATWSTQDNSKTYGADDPMPLTIGSGSGFLAADNVTATYGRVSGETVANSPYHITATLSPTGVLGNYNITNDGANFTIQPKAASVTADNKSKQYGDDNPALTATVTGTVNGDTLNYSLATTAVKFSSVGDYPITVTLGSNPNYTVTPTSGTLHINPKAATVTADNKSKQYGDDNPALTATVTGTVNGDTLNYSLATTAVKFSSAGDYPITVTVGSNPNYTVTPTNGTLHIDPKTATVAADNKSKTYGQANPTLTATVTGTVNGDTLNYTLATTALQFSNVGGYPITVTLGSNPNYSVTKTDGTLTINQAVATVTADNKSKTYGQANPTLTATVTGEVTGGDSVNYTLATTALQFSNVGGYPITVTLGSNPNYSVTKTDGTLTINQAVATVTADAKSKTYGQLNPTLTATVTGEVTGGDSVNYTLATTALQFSNVGGYPITVTLGSNPNYSVTKTDGTLTINQAVATVTADSKSKTYGQLNPTLTATVTGEVTGGDAVNYTLATTALQFSNVGGYPITVTLGSNPNYSVTKTDGTLTINQAVATVTADAKSKTYGQLNPTLTATVVGEVTGGDAVNYTLATTAAQFSNVGGYPITVTLGSNPNYSVTKTDGTLTINQAVATVTADAKSKTYGQLNPTLTATVTGEVTGGDAVNYTLATTALQFSNVGGYPITVTLGSNPNYSVTKTDGTLTINQAVATVTADAKSKTYGQLNPTLTATVTGEVTGGDPVNYTLATTAAQFSNVGGYPITVTLGSNPNYSVTKTDGTLTINQAVATVTADNKMKTYGQANPTLTATVVGEVTGGDAVNYTQATTALQFSNVGGYPITVTLGSNPNYSVTKTDGTLTINQAVATVTANDKMKTYGDANPTLTATVSGEVTGGDPVNYTLATTAAQFSNVGGYPITVTLGSNPNYSVTKTDGTLTIDQANATVTADNKMKIYGQANPTLTAVVTGEVTGGDSINYTLSTTALQFSNVGPYAITVNLGSNPNYNITVTDGTLTINQANATVTADNKMKTYGQANPTLTAVVAGEVAGGDSVNYTLATTAAQFSNVGPYAITVNLGSNPNYNITVTNGTLTINQANATVTADAKSKTYGQLNPGLTATVVGQVTGGDPVNYTLATTATQFSNVGGYPITVTLGSNPNYSVTKTDGTLTINQAVATVTADAKSKTYGQLNPGLTATVVGQVTGGDPVNYTLAITATQFSNVGGYPITVTLGSNPNYSVTKTDGTLTINQAVATVTAEAKSKTYGQLNPGLTATVVGQVTGGDPVNYTLATTATQFSNVGPYAITVTLGSNPNYSVTKTDGTLTINQAIATVTADSKTKAYLAPNPTLTATVVGQVTGGDPINYTLSTTATPTSVPGTYAIAVTLGSNPNYSMTKTDGMLSIGYGTCTGPNGPGGVILQPINADGTSVVKQGSTVPVKFTICDANGNPISDPMAVFGTSNGSITLISAVRGTVDNVNEAADNDIPDVAFRYSSGIWIFNMATNNLTKNTTYTYHINLKVGTINFTFGTK